MRIRTVQTGWTGAPGLSQHFFGSPTTGDFTQADVDAAVSAVRAFFFGVHTIFPSSWTATVETEAEILNPTTGALTGIMNGSTTPFPVAGSGANSGPTLAGAACTWRSSTVFSRRLARGRTFLVPLAASAYDTNGLLTPAASGAITTAGQALINDTATQLVIWHRPTKANPSGGQYTATMTASCSGKPVVLRSRRD